MKIRYLYNEENKIKYKTFNKDSIKLDKEYLVYAMCLENNIFWYCICNENYTYYPIWYSYKLFEVIDNRLSRFWVFKNDDNFFIFTFPDWAKDRYFNDKLTDGIKEQVEIFYKYKNLMDLEFTNHEINEVALIGDDEWLICPKCYDAWESKNKLDALLQCPNCKEILNNPRYQNTFPIEI